jgi:hypothetical protein
MKKIIIIWVIIFCKPLLSQYQDSIYTVKIAATLSPIISFYGYPRYSGAPDNATLGYGASIKAMWFPGRMLSVGIMTGYSFLVEDKIATGNGIEQPVNATARLTAIPLQAAVSMQDNNFEVGIGMGPYLMLSTIDYGRTAKGKRFELGLTLFTSYVFEVNEQIYIGPELRALYLSYRRILSFMPSISVHFNVYKY